MKILCFVSAFSWKMIGSFDMVNKEIGRPLKFYEASLFQFINPKAWSIAIAVASVFQLKKIFLLVFYLLLLQQQ